MSTPIGQIYADAAYALSLEGAAVYEFGPTDRTAWNALVVISPTLLLNIGNQVLAESLRRLTTPSWNGEFLVWISRTGTGPVVLVKMAAEGVADSEATTLEREFLDAEDASGKGEAL